MNYALLQALAAPLQGPGNALENFHTFHQQQSQPTAPQAQQLGQQAGYLMGRSFRPDLAPQYPTMGPIGQPGPGTVPGSPQQPPQGGVTRQGSQMIDANGQVIGHYGDQNQPVYNSGQGPGPLPGMPQGPYGGPSGWNDWPMHPLPPGFDPGKAAQDAQTKSPWVLPGNQQLFNQAQGRPINPFDPTDYARFSSAYAPPANPLSGYSLGRLGGR